ATRSRATATRSRYAGWNDALAAGLVRDGRRYNPALFTAMWFRNLLVYRITAPWRIEAEAFDAGLAQGRLQPCGSLAMESRGWVCPRDDERFIYSLNRHWLIALGVEEKLLPSSIVRQVADERAAELEKRQGHPVGRKQLRDLRIQVTDELLPRALARRRVTRAWIDIENSWL